MKRVYFLTTLFKVDEEDDYKVLGQKKTFNCDEAYKALNKLLDRTGLMSKGLEASIVRIIVEDYEPKVDYCLNFNIDVDIVK